MLQKNIHILNANHAIANVLEKQYAFELHAIGPQV